MAFENKSIESVYELIKDGLESEMNKRFRLLPKSFVHVICKVFSAVYISLYKIAGWIFLQLFVETATIDEVEVFGERISPLIYWGELVGVGRPGNATQWIGKARVDVVSQGKYLEQGTQLKSAATGKIYFVVESVLLEGESVSVPVKCAEAGTQGNLEVGDELKFTSNLENVGGKAIVEESEKASDAENESTYRARVKAKWQIQPQGGALGDYRAWAAEVPGVYQTFIYKDENSSNGVLIYVEADPAVEPSRIPSDAILKAVGEKCSYNDDGTARKPIGAVLDPDGDGTYKNIKPVIVTEFDVRINGYMPKASGGDITDFLTSAKNACEAYFLERETYIKGLSVERNDRINTMGLASLLSNEAESLGGYFYNVEIRQNGETVDYWELRQGELSKLGKLYVNSVEV